MVNTNAISPENGEEIDSNKSDSKHDSIYHLFLYCLNIKGSLLENGKEYNLVVDPGDSIVKRSQPVRSVDSCVNVCEKLDIGDVEGGSFVVKVSFWMLSDDSSAKVDEGFVDVGGLLKGEGMVCGVLWLDRDTLVTMKIGLERRADGERNGDCLRSGWMGEVRLSRFVEIVEENVRDSAKDNDINMDYVSPSGTVSEASTDIGINEKGERTEEEIRNENESSPTGVDSITEDDKNVLRPVESLSKKTITIINTPRPLEVTTYERYKDESDEEDSFVDLGNGIIVPQRRGPLMHYVQDERLFSNMTAPEGKLSPLQLISIKPIIDRRDAHVIAVKNTKRFGDVSSPELRVTHLVEDPDISDEEDDDERVAISNLPDKSNQQEESVRNRSCEQDETSSSTSANEPPKDNKTLQREQSLESEGEEMFPMDDNPDTSSTSSEDDLSTLSTTLNTSLSLGTSVSLPDLQAPTRQDPLSAKGLQGDNGEEKSLKENGVLKERVRRLVAENRVLKIELVNAQKIIRGMNGGKGGSVEFGNEVVLDVDADVRNSKESVEEFHGVRTNIRGECEIPSLSNGKVKNGVDGDAVMHESHRLLEVIERLKGELDVQREYNDIVEELKITKSQLVEERAEKEKLLAKVSELGVGGNGKSRSPLSASRKGLKSVTKDLFGFMSPKRKKGLNIMKKSEEEAVSPVSDQGDDGAWDGDPLLDHDQ
eukprot:Plantae.Rhodophyta-Hildenbrandia_rubra.ctg8664.p1 GENE.Plantae.Rhodophyta-Hildenbrandia_rubra.ctg8664~~Plantae.Rhodophyta-Hildenbrandia_rubra.ctg8664.p1  ORF type:complete len:709 (+),score=152.93 Plantae.Rhodophyta-Hildenbrandia_rubra.ctg8664:1722-3848(+)